MHSPMTAVPARWRPRRVTIVAASLILLAALPAKGGIVGMNIKPGLSFISVSEIIDLSVIGGGVHTTVPQFPDPDGSGPISGSNTTYLSGNLNVNLGPGTIEFLSGSQVNFLANNTPGIGAVPGSFAPFDPVTSPPVIPPSGATANANYGLETGAPLGFAEVRHGLVADLSIPGVRPLAGINFAYLPGTDALVATAGRFAFSSVSLSDTRSVVGDPLAFFGTGGSTSPTWDPLDLTAGPMGTLALPIESSFSVPLDLSSVVPGAVGTITYISNSVIVATPIPEPSSATLVAFGLFGLLSVARRLRWRRV